MQSSKITSYRIHAFGSLQISGESVLLIKGDKVRSLLAYLILNPRRLHRRELVAELLWQNSPPERVRRNLSDTLHRLQNEIVPDLIQIEADSISLQLSDNLWVDVWEFDSLILGNTPDDLQKAIDLYQGDLLPDIYDDWVLAERELRRSQYLSALEVVANQLEVDGKLQQALLFARRLILAEPLHEPAHQTYLRLLGRLRRFGEAFAHYDYLCELLRSELDSKPMAETSNIIDALVRERELGEVSLVEETKPLIGRKTELATALVAVDEMLAGNGSLLTVEGEAGMGKSRLLREIAVGARWRGVTVLQGQANQIPNDSPYSPLIDALNPLFRKLETALAPEMLATLAPLNMEWKNKFAITDEQGKLFYGALTVLGETLAKQTPTTLMLDNLHWADPALMDCLRAFAAGFIKHGGLLILAYRPMEQISAQNFLQAFEQRKNISLQPLSVDEVAQFMGAGAQTPEEIHAATGGNPFFITEWLTQPATQNTISIRLQSLSETAKLALQASSVLGTQIPYRLLANVSGLPPLVLANISDELIARGWLKSLPTGFEFEHELIRAAVYDAMPASGRRELHERAALAYGTFDPENLRARAFHLDRSERVEEAAAIYRLAGEQDISRFAYREAQTTFQRALTLSNKNMSVERIELQLALGGVAVSLGEGKPQIADLNEALADARTLKQKTLELSALILLGRIMIQTDHYAEAETNLQAALRLAQKEKDYLKLGEVHFFLGMSRTRQYQFAEAKKFYVQVLKLARKHKLLALEARALRGLGFAVSDLGDPREAIKWLEQAVEIFHRIGDRHGQSVSQSFIMKALYDLGAWDQLLDTANEILPQIEMLSLRSMTGYVRNLQGMAFYSLGDLSSARQCLLESKTDNQSIGASTILIDAALALVTEGEGELEEALLLYQRVLNVAVHDEEKNILKFDIGSLLWKLGQVRKALPYLESVRTEWLARESDLDLLKCEAYLGLTLLALDEKVRAQELAERGWSAFQKGIPTGELPQGWLWGLYQLLTALDQKASAQAVLHSAYAELQRQASAIGNAEMRRSFFVRVPLNAEIVKAHDALHGVARVITVSLARKDVPLGRSLRDDEFVSVQWTVDAPEDEAFTDKAERRQHRLKRLLAESSTQNAAPTDDDLASALGVSRRTMLRDMQMLREEMISPTRKRKK